MKTSSKIAAFIGAIAALALGILIFVSVREGGDDDYSVTFSEKSLVYAAEITRHGARAPLIDSENFTVAAGQLTPMGMRQRYLLGRFYYEKYFTRFEELNAKNPTIDFLSNLWIASTNVDRTKQSAHSQYLGFTEAIREKTIPQLSPPQKSDFMNGGSRGLSIFKVRNLTEISSQLGPNAILNSYAGFPLHITEE